jgi:uncharacterized protein (UPF0332 family)
MPIKYQEITAVAFSLLNEKPCTEAALRSSMSRSYYGLYHAALLFADSVSVPPVSATGGSVHSKLGAYYQSNVDKAVRLQMRKVGYSLKALHELRCKADYHLSANVDQLEADTVYQRCLDIIGVVEQLEANKAA